MKRLRRLYWKLRRIFNPVAGYYSCPHSWIKSTSMNSQGDALEIFEVCENCGIERFFRGQDPVKVFTIRPPRPPADEATPYR